MVKKNLLQQLLCDDDSLSRYYNGELVTIDDIRRSLFLKQRVEDRRIPDQYYSMIKSKSFKGILTVSECIQQGIYKIADAHLKTDRQNKVTVKFRMQNSWQELLPYLPPLIMFAAFISEKRKCSRFDSKSLNTYFKKHILPNIKHTALLGTNYPPLNSLIADGNGLHDLHMHLNGATETDNAWQDYLLAPDKVYAELDKAFRIEKVKEQLEQESYLLQPLKFYHLLRIARRLRTALFELAFYPNDAKYTQFSQQGILHAILDTDNESVISNNYHNSFLDILEAPPSGETQDLATEAMMYVILLSLIKKNDASVITPLFHFYLLILGLCNRLLVQQTHQYGFEQFQKHTLNGLREYSETAYRKRFQQMRGNHLDHLAFLEGRLSPKDATDKVTAMINSIEKGWNISPIDPPNLKLVAHFIKRPDTNPDEYVRHYELRKDIWERAHILELLKVNYPKGYGDKISAIDAAASEFDTPPEVFAPVFRKLFRAGFAKQTYHAGEDFYHIAGGMRAIFEAITFNELPELSRIGHATAAGLPTKQWIESIGKQILIPIGEWLDTLVFIHHFITTRNNTTLLRRRDRIERRIEFLAKKIYSFSSSGTVLINELTQAYLFRKYCPILALHEHEAQVRNESVFDEYEWWDQRMLRVPSPARNFYLSYHSKGTRDKSEALLTIPIMDVLTIGFVEELQDELLKFMMDKKIIIETLPTSNVRIGVHRTYADYHLKHWLKKGSGRVPPIVVGTDDTGIFATNIYNEYANLYCYLYHQRGIPNSSIIDILTTLNTNGLKHRFN